MKVTKISLAIAAVLAASLVQASEVRRPYIVQMAAAPVASYTGNVPGLAATKPAAGQRLDLTADSVQAYINHLETVREQTIQTLPSVQTTNEFNLVFNGFTALLTDSEVRALKKNSAVAKIQLDEPQELATNYTPGFLGLDLPGGIWERAGGQGAAGEDIIIGVIDSGISPENPAFSDRVDAKGQATHDLSGTLVYGPAPAKWKGECTSGEGFAPTNCNNKLIGAQYFDSTYRSLVQQGLYTPHWQDFRSPRDNGGHGTHTASTAGGNANAPASVGGIPMALASGIAPRARIAAYKVCWSYQDPANTALPKNSCFTGDNVAAIEKAVKDGVDVLNYSISGSQTTVNDAVELAFLGASNAGIFVSASAGNSGPGNQVAHLGPWLTTVGASTHDRMNEATVTLGNAQSFKGGSLNAEALPQTAIIYARDAAKDGANLTQAALCFGSADNVSLLDPVKVSGKVVFCDRGSNALVNKSTAVREAGGAGIIIGNVAGGADNLLSLDHKLPAVHINRSGADAVKSYIAATPAATAGFSAFKTVKGSTPAPVMASFSSRGPNRGYASMLKPDLTAPGVDILAGYVPALTQEQRNAVAAGQPAPAAWDFLQGTSMSSPHVAGLGALLKQLYPTWTPAMIKSALMTTGMMTINDGLPGAQNGLLPWAQGAGHVVPNRAINPGLVYNIQPVDYNRFLCGISSPAVPVATCNQIGRLSEAQLNLPSITVGAVLGKSTVSRTVTNVSDEVATFTAAATVPGYTVAVTPASLTLQPGQSGSFSVEVTRTTAALNAWAYGSLVWSNAKHTVRSPLTVRATGLSVASSLYSEQQTGRMLYTLGTGFNGAMSSQVAGLKAATVTSYTIGQAVAGSIDTSSQLAAACLARADGTLLADLVVPANTLVLKAATYDAETSGRGSKAGDDIDMVLLNPANAVIATSLRTGSDEQVVVTTPAAGTYKVCLGGYALSNGASSQFNLSTWAVTTADRGGNLRVALPGSAVLGGTATAAASWSGLAAGQRFLGAVRYIQGSTAVGTTVLAVETNDPLPEIEGQKSEVVLNRM